MEVIKNNNYVIIDYTYLLNLYKDKLNNLGNIITKIKNEKFRLVLNRYDTNYIKVKNKVLNEILKQIFMKEKINGELFYINNIDYEFCTFANGTVLYSASNGIVTEITDYGWIKYYLNNKEKVIRKYEFNEKYTDELQSVIDIDYDSGKKSTEFYREKLMVNSIEEINNKTERIYHYINATDFIIEDITLYKNIKRHYSNKVLIKTETNDIISLYKEELFYKNKITNKLIVTYNDKSTEINSYDVNIDYEKDTFKVDINNINEDFLKLINDL